MANKTSKQRKDIRGCGDSVDRRASTQAQPGYGPDDFRLVAVLSFLEGFSYQEIAEIADLQLGTVKSRLHRGRKLLQKQLFDYAVKNGYIKEKAK